MRVLKSSENPENRFCKEEEQFHNLELPFCQAIENAGGVPYHLIFGPEFGEGSYVNVGEGIRALLNIEPDEFTEKLYQSMIEEIVPLGDDIPVYPVEIRERFISGGIKSYKADVLVRTSGGVKWLRDSSLPLTDEVTGKVIGSFGILLDISEQKQILINLKRANELAEESDRLKSAFLHNISHEIRTPLNAIVGFSTLLGEPGHPQDQRQEFLEILTRSTDHLLSLINDIVEISKIEAHSVKISKKEVKLNQIVQKVYDRFVSNAGTKRILFSCRTPADDEGSIIMTDNFKLLQVLSNLVGNALKFTREGKIEFGYSFKDDEVEFFISDTGIGIPHEFHHMIFNSFYQAESSNTRSFEGTGLGLAISKAYVELLGGKIWFTSQSGKGSVFYFTLPSERVGV